MSTTTTIPVETVNRCDPSKVSVGDVYSRHSFGKITQINRMSRMMVVENSNGATWSIGMDIVAKEFSFAEQFEEEEKISRTRMIEIMLENPRTAMTINFNKKPDPKKIAKELEAGRGDQSAKAWNARVKELVAGEERTMVGYHVCSFDEHRRLRFQETDKGQRLVDPRTLNWMIVDRVKYTATK